MEIKIKRICKDIDLPEQIDIGNWIDLRAAEDVFIPEGRCEMIPLGIAMQLPEGYEALVVPRSSTFKRYGIIMTNSIGVIDTSYCGDNDQWRFPAMCLNGGTIRNGVKGTLIEKNERICQFRIIESMPKIVLKEVETLGNVDRGGFGSTGVK